MPEKEGAEEKKTTKEVVNKKQKQILNQEDYIPEEGYDVARDEGRVSPTKDKKDATTAPRKPMSAKERKKAMQQAQQRSQIAVNNVVTALRKKYGKDAVMYTQKTSKAKSNEELDLSQVAESLGGYVIDESSVQGDDFGLYDFDKKQLERLKKAERRQQGRAMRRADAGADELLDQIQGKVPTGKKAAAAKDARIIDKQMRKAKMEGKPFKNPVIRSARKRYKNQPSLDQVQRDIDRKELVKNKSYRDTKVKQSFEKSKNIKTAGPSSLSQRQSRVIGRGSKNIPSSVVKNVKATPQRAVSASQKIGKAVGKPLTKAADATKVVGSTAQGLGKIANQGVVKPSFQALRQSKLGKSGATVVDMGKTAVGKVSKGLSVGNLKTVGKTVGKRAFGKGGALAAKTIGRAGAKFGAKRIYGVGSAIAGAEAIGRFATGDIVGGTLAGAEAITGLIPGLGTGVSAGLGAVGLARDLKRTKQVVGAVRKAKNLRKFKPVTKGFVGQKSNLNKFVKGSVKPKNRTSTAIGLAGAGTVGSNVSDRRRNRLRLPNLPAPSLTGGSAGFRSAG